MKNLLVAFLALAGLSACASAPKSETPAGASDLKVKITAMASDPSRGPAAFVLEPEESTQDPNDAQYGRVARMATRALEMAHFTAAPDAKRAELRIQLAYASGDRSRSIRLQALKYKSASRAVLWQIRIQGPGGEGDASAYAPLLAAAVPYIGKDLPQQREEAASATAPDAVKIAAP